MNNELSPNAQAILLLTAPLLAGGSRPSVRPLSLGDYNKLVRHLHDTNMLPPISLIPKAWGNSATRGPG